MSQTCFKKCVVKFHDPDLAVGEMTCVDRCVGKINKIDNIIF